MNKSLEALLRGYVMFDVNGQKFWTYNAALRQRMIWSKGCAGISFTGFNLVRGTVCFYSRSRYSDPYTVEQRNDNGWYERPPSFNMTAEK